MWVFSTIIMDLSKAYDCLPHHLLIVKLETYDLDMIRLSLLKHYSSNHRQRTKVGSTLSDWFEFIRGIPECSILDSLLSNIFTSYINF